MPSRPGFDHMQSRLFLVFLVLTLCLGLTGYLYYDHQKQHVRKNIEDELSAIADLKVGQITAWRNERLKDAMSIARNPVIAEVVRRYLQGPASPEVEHEVLLWMNALREVASYQSVLLFDPGGRVRLSTAREQHALVSHVRPLIAETMRTRKPHLSDLHNIPDVNFIHLDLVAPLLVERSNGETAVAAVLIRLDPRGFLFPLIQSWPGASRTAETLLVRKEQDEVLFLNELRHQQGTAFVRRAPLSAEWLPAAMAVRGMAGAFEGIDYRGTPVLAATRAVQDTPWFLIAKIDQREIYAPVRDQARMIAVVTALLMAAAALSILFWWRQRNADYARAQYEAEVKRENLARQYDHLIRYVNDIILLVDPEGRIVEANDRAVAAYGYEREELLRMTVRDIRAPESRGTIESQLDEARRHGGLIFETTHQRRDGSPFPVEVSSRAIDIGGKSFLQNIIRDVTERKQAERALIESEDRYRHLVQSVTDYIYTVEVENGRAVRTTHGPGCVTVTGYTPEDHRADPDLWFRMIFEEDRPAVLEQAARILTGSRMAPLEHRIIHKDNSLRWVRNTPVPRFDQGGRLIAYDGLITDITRLKLLENQLRQAQKMEAVGQLAGGISHDFNNILTAIIGYANLIMMKLKAGDPSRAFVEAILTSAERAAHLTSDLLAFSRKQIINLKPVSVNDIIRRVEKLLTRVIGEDIVFRTSLSSDDHSVLADSIQIEHVLMNLATNARDAMPDGGALTIETGVYELGEDFVRANSFGKPGRYVSISVTDTGIGMDEKVRSRIFDPFFTTKEVGKGTGLGLSMVYGIVKQHNGYITVASEPGKGATFTIYLPFTGAAAAAEQPCQAGEMTSGKETVLLAEDDTSVRELTRRVLEGAGYTVIEASDGADAVRKFSENKGAIHLLVLDIIMPMKNGKEAYLEIKAACPGIKVLFTSGYTADIIQKKGILETGLDFILKPITPVEFLKKVREVLDKT